MRRYTASEGTLRRWTSTCLAACAAVPATIVLHELGHWAAAAIFGAPAVLHYASTTQGGTLTRLQLGIFDLAGPAASMTLAAAACLVIARSAAQPMAMAIATIAPLRFAIGLVYLFVLLVSQVQGHPAPTADFDEFNAALNLSLSPVLLIALESAVWFLELRWLAGAIPQGQLVASGSALAAGAAVGLFLWFSFLGPVLLP